MPRPGRADLATCDRSYIISDGRILKQGDAATLAADPEVRRVYLGERFELGAQQARRPTSIKRTNINNAPKPRRPRN